MPIRRTTPSSHDIAWMRRAIQLAAQCETEPGKAVASPKVGAVAISPSGDLIAEAHRGALSPGDHAEFCLISTAGPGALTGATVYTTLEPCTQRTAPKIPCADRLVAEGIAVVYIGMLDPDPRIRELGWSALGNAGIDRRDFTSELRQQVLAMNQSFLDRFRVARGATGEITFDYMQDDGRLRIEHEGTVFHTRWTMAGHGSIHAYGPSGSVALSRTATDFSDIDDPELYEFEGHSKHVSEGQIVIFRNDCGFALVRVESVLAGPDRGDPNTAAVISYELRLPT